MKALRCRGGKLARFFCYILLTISFVIFGSMSFSWSSSLEQTSALAKAAEILPQKEMIEKVETGTIQNWMVQPISYSYSAPSINFSNYISILGRTVEFVNTNTTNITPDYQIARYFNGPYNGKFYFGHNSNYILGGLANLPVGSVFSITIDGYTHYYRIDCLETVEKSAIMNGEMADIAMAKWRGQSYSVSLMTCAGQSYGGGDASHRTLAFANEI